MSMRYPAGFISAFYNPLKVPDAPTIGTATAGSNLNATVTFTAPSNVGGSAITQYTVISSPGGITATGASSPVTVTGLTLGTSYTFTVTAANSNGAGRASAASNSITATNIAVPQYIALAGSLGVLAYTYNVSTASFTDVSATYVPAGSPQVASSGEGIATNGQGTKVIATGFTTVLRCATFDLASTPWVMTSQAALPIGTSGSAFGGSPCVNSRGTYVVVSSKAAGGAYYSASTANSWTSMAVNTTAVRTAAGHNRFYIANSDTDLRCYAGTGAPSYISSINCGSSENMDASERTYDPTSYTNPPTNEIIVVSGATSAIILYTASTNSYSILRQGSVSDGLPATVSASITRDGTRAVFANATTAYIYNIDPTAGTASLFTSFAISGAVNTRATNVGIFPNGNAIVLSNALTQLLKVYNMSGTVLSTSSSVGATVYGLACVYNGVNYS